MAEVQLVVFGIDHEEYAIPITQVREIIRTQGATKLPDTPDYMQGITSLRGKIIPVIDLAMRLGLASAGPADRRTLIIEAAGREIGLVVDAVTEVLRLPESAIDPVPSAANRGYIRGIGKHGGRLLILLDVDMLFAEEELPAMVEAV